MNYQEVIETLQDIHDVAEYRIKNGDARGVIYIPPDKLEDVKTAISALQELKLYNDSKLCLIPESVYSKQCTELDAYKQLMLGEIKNAVEKQIPKKVTNASNGDKLRFGTCPSCNKRISNVEGGNYCQNCGQRLEWEDE